MKKIICSILVFVIFCSTTLVFGEEFNAQNIPVNKFTGAYIRAEGEFWGIRQTQSRIKFYARTAHKTAFDFIYEQLYNAYRINEEGYSGLYKNGDYYCLALADNGYYITLGELQNILEQINCEYGEIMLDKNYRYSLTENEVYVADVGVTFLFDVEELQNKRDKIDAAINSIVTTLKASDLSDMEKVLIVHDWICQRTIYQPDETLVNEAYYHNIYAALVDGVSVCQGYTQAMCYILAKLGIECVSCICDEKNHVWNCVKLNGKWYHVDATWDDGLVYDDDYNPVFTYVVYNNFLKSTTDMALNKNVDKSVFTYISGDITNDDAENSDYNSGYVFNNQADGLISLNNEKIGANGFSYSDGKLIYTIKTDEGGFFESEYNFEFTNPRACDYAVSKPVEVSDGLQFMLIKQNQSITQTFSHTGYMKNNTAAGFTVNTFSVSPAFEKTVGEYYTFSKISDSQMLEKINNSSDTEFFFWDMHLAPLTQKTTYQNSN